MRASEGSDKTMKEYGLVGKQMLLGLPAQGFPVIGTSAF